MRLWVVFTVFTVYKLFKQETKIQNAIMTISKNHQITPDLNKISQHLFSQELCKLTA